MFVTVDLQVTFHTQWIGYSRPSSFSLIYLYKIYVLDI